MIIKNTFNKVSIHPLFLFVAASALFTGLFEEFTILFIIIVIHEMGHLLVANHYHFNIYKIYLYPFGGYIKFNDKLNRPLREEFLVLIGGPLCQIIFYMLMSFCYNIGLVNTNTFAIFTNYHYSLLIFNLLPIFPLDGSKLVNILLSKFISFKQSHLAMLYISYVVLLIALIATRYLNIGINLYLLLLLLLYKIIDEQKQHKAICNRFLLERYLYNFQFSRHKIIHGNKLSRMMRDKKHIFVVNNHEVTEKEMLRQKYGRYNNKNM